MTSYAGGKYHFEPPIKCGELPGTGVVAAFAAQARHMDRIKDRGAWARFWANMGGVEYDVAPLIFDSAKYMASGVESHYRWCGEWYGTPVKVKRALA